MKYNIVSYFLGEGFRNLLKNKKSTISCLGVMCVTMLMFGLFYSIGKNITHMVKEIEAEQGMQVFIVTEATQDEIDEIGEKIRKINGVNQVTPVSQEDAYNQMKERLGDRQSLMEGLEPSIFKSSYLVTLTDLTLNSSVQNEINELENIDKITSSNETINNLSIFGKWIRIITGGILIILIIISVFIISNTIKLTVHARRKEISIMKYVGATNNFIRSPFIVEGIIIGLLSSIISVLLVSGLYSFVANKIAMADFDLGVTVLGLGDLLTQIIVVYALLGMGIGIVGSSISMRKYLDV
ncbi:MAG: permease-like cell division protein FtsX [Clostridia bacterium]|nr:permease-like cell division protein FtsX [Clostridia bacterium]